MELIILLVVIAFILRLPKVKGILGEKSVALFLSKLDPKEYRVFHDLYIPTAKGKTTQIDHLIISRYGIFVIETKNYKGWIFGSEKNKYWTQVIYQRKERFYNPIHQNYGHIKVVQDYLQLEDSDVFHSMIAFSMRATLKKIEVHDTRTIVTYIPRISKMISKHQKQLLSHFQANQFVEKLEQLKRSDRNERKKHVQTVKKTLSEEKKKVRENVCPKCDGNLVNRKGKYDVFKGCSNFPNCRYVTKKTS
ncbi:NERD domain-containing protein [Metabacillus halosaccharovorans]|uniref:NERD domain-containing protein n=1 Tax=Metabacillus halosaccharovorans TaxID=930124 RepID=UPI00203E0F26|nr:NERD domain-containing protein [Metabacillus halosaccharovorans]MCM3443526.1 NERD domain-containing protein [Metabacillus halosaccharovorans]